MSVQTERKKAKRLTIDERIELLHRLEAGESCTAFADSYGITKSAVTWIKKNIENCFQQKRSIDAAGGSTSKKRRCSGVEESRLEKSLHKWLIQKRTIGQHVTTSQLRKKALVFSEHLNGPSSFKASDGFLQGFRRRHGIVNSSARGDELPFHRTGSSNFSKEFIQFVTKNGYGLDQIYNADGTGLHWKSLPSKAATKSKDINFLDQRRSDDERVTLMLCANASGNHKLPPMVVGKLGKKRCLKNIKVLPVTYRRQKNSWIHRRIAVRWYAEIFLPEIERVHGKSAKCVLLLNHAPCHPSEEELNALSDQCVVKYLPPGVSDNVQPMGQGIIEKLKKVYKKNLLCLSLTEDSSERVEKLLDSLNMLHCVNFIASAWNNVTATNVRNAWKNIFPVDYDLEFVDFDLQADAFFDLASRIPGLEDISTEDINRWLKNDCDPGWRILTDQEILRETCSEDEECDKDIIDDDEDDDDDDDDDDSEESQMEPSAKDALRSIEVFSLWYQTQWECTPEALLLLESLRALSIEQIVAEKRFLMDAQQRNK